MNIVNINAAVLERNMSFVSCSRCTPPVSPKTDEVIRCVTALVSDASDPVTPRQFTSPAAFSFQSVTRVQFNPIRAHWLQNLSNVPCYNSLKAAKEKRNWMLLAQLPSQLRSQLWGKTSELIDDVVNHCTREFTTIEDYLFKRGNKEENTAMTYGSPTAHIYIPVNPRSWAKKMLFKNDNPTLEGHDHKQSPAWCLHSWHPANPVCILTVFDHSDNRPVYL